MFRKIAALIDFPRWVERESDDDAQRRYKKLELRDRLLDGTFYDHLRHAFYDERDQANTVIKIVERRPSAQYRLPRMVARWCSRKLFAGRHIPRLRHKDKAALRRVNAVLRRAEFWDVMKDAVLLGSVGSIAATFRIDEDDPDDPRVKVSLWRAKYCTPSFSPMGELSQLRVAYQTTGAAFISLGHAETATCVPNQVYWFVRDYTPDGEVTYEPVKRDVWNPVEGFVGEGAATAKLTEWQSVPHDLGFVLGHWFRNLPGGTGPDGACTFEDAIPNSIEIDYNFSQLGRGVRYNCAPTLMTRGRVGEYTVGTIQEIQVDPGHKGEDGGEATGAGDAKLLEMDGHGTESALKMVDQLRNYALEQIAASRKDPDKMKAPLSGRAMEYLDQDSDDLVHDLRSQYGQNGALPLIKKIVVALDLFSIKTVGSLALQWPRLFQPTPDEVLQLVQALALAMDPLKQTSPATPGKQPASAMGSIEPPMPATLPGEETQLLTRDEARALLTQALDLSMIDEEGDEEGDGDVELSPTSPGDPTPVAPPPLPIDLPAPAPGVDDPPAAGDDPAGHVGNMRIGAPAFVDA